MRISTTGGILPLQFENLASFSAVIDRLGEFQEVLESSAMARPTTEHMQVSSAEDGAGAAAISMPAGARGAPATGGSGAGVAADAPAHAVEGGLIRIIDRLGKGRHLMLPATCPLIVVPWHAEVQLEPKAEQPGLPCRC